MVELIEGVSSARNKAVLALCSGELSPDKFPCVLEEERQCYHRPRFSERVMCALNWLIGGYGVEAHPVEGAWVDSYHRRFVASYVNMGDAYSQTAVLDHSTGEFSVTSYGDWLEAYEARKDRA